MDIDKIYAMIAQYSKSSSEDKYLDMHRLPFRRFFKAYTGRQPYDGEKLIIKGVTIRAVR